MKPVYYGWVVTGCAFVVLFLAYGVQYSFGVFLPAIADDVGWPRAIIGGAFSFYTLVYTVFSLVSGKLTDLFGPRRVVGLGGLLLGIGVIATSRMSSQWELFFWYGIVAALGMSTAYIPCNMTVVRWFLRRRGLALGIASSGASCGILIVPLCAAVLIAHTDWRTAMLALGIGMLVIISIVARLMLGEPGENGVALDGGDDISPKPTHSLSGLATAASQVHGSGWTLHEARRAPSFWVFVSAFALSMVTITVPFVHIGGFARDIGLSDIEGALAVSVIGLFALVGSVLLGVLSDQVGSKASMALALGAQIAAFSLFSIADSAALLYAGTVAFGFSYGGVATLFPARVGDLFGSTHAGAIGGFIFAAGGLLGAWGPALAGYLRDVQGDFRLAFLLCVLSAGLAFLLFILLPRSARI